MAAKNGANPATCGDTTKTNNQFSQTERIKRQSLIIINALDPNMVETQNFASLHNETKQKFGPQSKNLASVVRGFKIGVTKYANDQDFSFAWQPRFHDHIIRNHNEMDHIADYIENNIILWKEDCYNGLRSQPISNNPEKPYLKFF